MWTRRSGTNDLSVSIEFLTMADVVFDKENQSPNKIAKHKLASARIKISPNQSLNLHGVKPSPQIKSHVSSSISLFDIYFTLHVVLKKFISKFSWIKLVWIYDFFPLPGIYLRGLRCIRWPCQEEDLPDLVGHLQGKSTSNQCPICRLLQV